MNRVLVTGADGFIGSHLVELLNERGYSVTALAQYYSFNSIGWLSSINCIDDTKIILGDIRDPNFCNELLKDIDIVFHLAALIAIPYSYVSPHSYLETNVNGTLNICEAAKNNKVKKLFNISTSEVYGTAKYVPIDENHPLQPQSPYSASKISAESIALSFFNAFELPVVVIRPFNTYGPRQSARAVLPTIICQIAHGKKEIHLGDTSPTRDFNYVTDTCMSLISLIKCDNILGKIINIGSNNEVSIAKAVDIIKEFMGSDIKIIQDKKRIRPIKSEVFRLRCDNSLFLKLTSYKQKENFRSGILKTINWMKKPENLKLYNAKKYIT